jgi:metallophosphoesterase superfamily enzyme
MPKGAEPFGTVRDRAVYLPDADTLVAADLHLGKVAASPVNAPVPAGADMIDRLEDLLYLFHPAEVVLAGDVLHTYGFVPRAARESLAALTDCVMAAGATVTAVEGNHDAQLNAVTDLATTESHELSEGTIVSHGHEAPEIEAPRFVIGHDHPTIEIEGRRRACYLQASTIYDGADVLALPAFNPAVRGTLVNGLVDGDPLSPFLADLSQFQPVVWDEGTGEPVVFPPLETLRPFL